LGAGFQAEFERSKPRGISYKLGSCLIDRDTVLNVGPVCFSRMRSGQKSSHAASVIATPIAVGPCTIKGQAGEHVKRFPVIG
jgi:hypothetical protein